MRGEKVVVGYVFYGTRYNRLSKSTLLRSMPNREQSASSPQETSSVATSVRGVVNACVSDYHILVERRHNLQRRRGAGRHFIVCCTFIQSLIKSNLN